MFFGESRHIIELLEYQPVFVPKEELPMAAAQVLHDTYRAQISVELPAFSHSSVWKLTSQGWVGYIPLTREIGISLQPKVSLHNLFGMLEIAYHLQSFKWLNDLYDATSLAEFYERLAIIFAQLTSQRLRQGIYRAYESHADELPYLRGRMEISKVLQRPWHVALPCIFEEHTSDIEENQILVGAFHRILSSGNCTSRSLPLVETVYRNLQNVATTTTIDPQLCLNRFYNRLNADYRPLHALSYFFLADSGPSHKVGEQHMVPFLVDMARLYERFVSEWLKSNLDQRYTLRAQERHIIDPLTDLHFDIDLVIRDVLTGHVRWVLDTKYKVPNGGPSMEDIAQINTYANSKGAHEAILIYPVPLSVPVDIRIDDVRIRTLTFSLDGDLDEAGQKFLQALNG
jgi:5-methylcytosine-specific restriction enzyme subunit McrC